jgi:hypothetical protein
LYGLRLTYGEALMRNFPTTGSETLNIVLLAFAAAAVGKLLTLFVATAMAITWQLQNEQKFEGLARALKNATQREYAFGRHDRGTLLIRARQSVAAMLPQRDTQLEQIHTNAVFAYVIGKGTDRVVPTRNFGTEQT